ncbi:MAG: outer membrane lipoprotein chaperone LolA [Xanthomonadales bacterium]|nr:outer membrane lipoprotein chaperone LolA [Gammaproteobacteria bacterium]NNE04476.1 outer membrane lipoprotein chaperone LolA [Xanthomonadales bacterium]NNL95731.1 outer membrane lipoprotein chaperone LolA [Xanthomonadales bacterium]
MQKYFLSLLLVTGLVAAGEAGPARQGLEQFTQELKGLHARFSQVVVNADGGIESEGRGEVWMSSPDRFRWTYTGEFPELIVADGKNVWLYDESLEQVTVKPQSDEAGDSPLLLLTDLEALDEKFTITEIGDYQGADMMALESRSAESEFERVLLGFESGQLVLMGLEDAFGMRTELRFEAIERNPGLDPGLFLFVPPEGADVVGEAELASSP